MVQKYDAEKSGVSNRVLLGFFIYRFILLHGDKFMFKNVLSEYF